MAVHSLHNHYALPERRNDVIDYYCAFGGYCSVGGVQAMRYAKYEATAMQSAYCPTCRKRTLHGEKVQLATVVVSWHKQFIGVTAALLCCPGDCLATYQAKLNAVYVGNPQRLLFVELGCLKQSVAVRLQDSSHMSI